MPERLRPSDRPAVAVRTDHASLGRSWPWSGRDSGHGQSLPSALPVPLRWPGRWRARQEGVLIDERHDSRHLRRHERHEKQADNRRGGQRFPRHGQVRVILIRSTEHRAFYAPPVDPPDWEVRQQHARDDLAATLRAALGPGPRDNLTTEIAEGMAERILIDRSARADLLVLGSAPEHPTGRVIGPVIRSCLTRARCPVVVVRPEGPSTGRPANSADATRDNLELLRAGAMPG